MPKSLYDIAEEAMPGWRAVRRDDVCSQTEPQSQVRTPDTLDLRTNPPADPALPGGKNSPEMPVSGEQSGFIEMDLNSKKYGPMRRVVVVSNGKVIAVQG